MQKQFGATSQPDASAGTLIAAVVLSLGLGWALSYALGSVITRKRPPRLKAAHWPEPEWDDDEYGGGYDDGYDGGYDDGYDDGYDGGYDGDYDLALMPPDRTAAMVQRAKGAGRWGKHKAGKMVEGVRRLPWGHYGQAAKAGAGKAGRYAQKKVVPWAKTRAEQAGEFARTKASPWAKKHAKRAGQWGWDKAKRGYQAAADAPYSEYRRAVESKLDRAQRWVAGEPSRLLPPHSDFATRDTEIGPEPTFATRPTIFAQPAGFRPPDRSKTWISPGATLIGDEPGSAVPNRRRRGKRGGGDSDSESAGSVEGRARAYLSDIVRYSRSTDMEYLDPRRVISMAEKGMKRAFGDKNPAAGRLIQKKLQGHPANVSHALLMFATNAMPGSFDEAFTQRGPGRDRRPRTEYKRSKVRSRGRSARTYGRKTSKRRSSRKKTGR